MRCNATILVVTSLVATGCVNIPDTYAPPMQRKATPGPDTSNLKHFVAMSDEHAADHFLRDIGSTLEGGSWRWTGQKPTVRLYLGRVQGLSLSMDFSISDQTMRQTGPVTITYWVNGKVLDKVRYEKPGPQHFKKKVVESWLYKNGDNVVTAELDKVYVAEDDSAKLGVTLTRIGFLD